jgi:hypothetical protein
MNALMPSQHCAMQRPVDIAGVPVIRAADSAVVPRASAVSPAAKTFNTLYIRSKYGSHNASVRRPFGDGAQAAVKHGAISEARPDESKARQQQHDEDHTPKACIIEALVEMQPQGRADESRRRRYGDGRKGAHSD